VKESPRRQIQPAGNAKIWRCSHANDHNQIRVYLRRILRNQAGTVPKEIDLRREIRKEQQNEQKSGNRWTIGMVSDKQTRITVTWRFIETTVATK
jgi:hypothetical protein